MPDCLAVSEAGDGAAAGAANVFAVILGTGVGGGIAIGGMEPREGIEPPMADYKSVNRW